jgi:hypothetical protein
MKDLSNFVFYFSKVDKHKHFLIDSITVSRKKMILIF